MSPPCRVLGYRGLCIDPVNELACERDTMHKKARKYNKFLATTSRSIGLRFADPLVDTKVGKHFFCSSPFELTKDKRRRRKGREGSSRRRWWGRTSAKKNVFKGGGGGGARLYLCLTKLFSTFSGGGSNGTNSVKEGPYIFSEDRTVPQNQFLKTDPSTRSLLRYSRDAAQLPRNYAK
jgi:hypothetical protein